MYTGLVKNSVQSCITYVNSWVFQRVNGWKYVRLNIIINVHSIGLIIIDLSWSNRQGQDLKWVRYTFFISDSCMKNIN